MLQTFVGVRIHEFLVGLDAKCDQYLSKYLKLKELPSKSK